MIAIFFIAIALIIILIVSIFSVIILGSYNANMNQMLTCDTITIEGTDSGTYDINEYVAGVIDAYTIIDGVQKAGPETIKALSLIVRSYSFLVSQACSTAIKNSEEELLFILPTDETRILVEETKKQRLFTKDGMLANVNFSTFPGQNNLSYPAVPIYDSTEDVYNTTFFVNDIPKQLKIPSRKSDGTYWLSRSLGDEDGDNTDFSIIGSMALEEVYSYKYISIIDFFYESYKADEGNNQFPGYMGDPGTFEPILDPYDVEYNAEVLAPQYFDKFPKESYGRRGNCTWYAHGRVKQIINQIYANGEMTEEEYNFKISALSKINGNGGQWYENNGGFPTGTVPRVGALAVYEGTSGPGHVAVVEQVTGNNTYITSDGGSGFEHPQGYGITSCSGDNAPSCDKRKSPKCKLIGFIYVI